MSNKQAVYEKLDLLKEPLISQPTEMGIKKGFLSSLFRSTESHQVDEQVRENQEAFDQILHQQRSKPSFYRPAPEAGAIQLPDFYEENKALFNGEARTKRSKDDKKANDGFSFYKQATAQHQIPVTKIVQFSYLKTDPSTFAVVTQASRFFKQDSLLVKELMCLDDYKVLQKLRLRNYLYILKTLYQVEDSADFHKDIKLKLHQVEKVLVYLDMLHEKPSRPYDYGKNEFDSIYEKLDADEDISKPYVKAEYDRSKPAAEYEDFDSDDGEPQEEDEGADIDEENEYFDFFRCSNLVDNTASINEYNQALLLEEEKWVQRAIWLEQQIERFSADPDKKFWVTWFQAKFDSLKDLDVNIKGSDKEDPNNYVFYVHQFLKDYLAEQEKKSRTVDDDDIEQYIRNAEYTKDQQVYIDLPNMYPGVYFEQKDAVNTNKPQIMAAHNFREKLCMKVMTRERETDYFLTVYKKKELGSEKIYEKRLNLGNKDITVRKLQFQPSKGQFILLSIVKGTNGEYKDYEGEESEEERQSEDGGNQDDDYGKESDDQSHKSSHKSEEHSEHAEDEEKPEEKEPSEAGSHHSEAHKREKTRKNKKYYTIDLIFNIQAQFKNPLLIKPKTLSLGFYGDKHFYSVQKDFKLPNEKTSLRVYEYDLHNFEKIRVQDLTHQQFNNFDKEDKKKGLIGKVRDGGFFKIFATTVDKEITQHILKGNEVYELDPLPKPLKYLEASNIPQPRAVAGGDKAQGSQANHGGDSSMKKSITEQKNNGKQYIAINEKGDKMLVIRLQDEGLKIIRFLQDTSAAKTEGAKKKFKIDPTPMDTKQIEALFPLDKGAKSYYFRIFPTFNDFIILGADLNNQMVYVFHNEQLITKVQSNLNDIYFNIQDNQIKAIYDIKKQIQCKTVLECNQFYYTMWDREQASEGWFEVQHEVINQQKIVHFPYVFFIYNHDQLFMKDLTQVKDQGYFYMNHFLGISSKERPITVHTYNQWGSMVVNVPIVDSRYTPGSFYIRVNQYFGSPTLTQPDKFGPYLFYAVYSFNEELRSKVNQWAHAITNDKGELDKDVRISFEHGVLKIEKWSKNKCVERNYISHYTQAYDPKVRDISNPRLCDDYSLFLKQEVFRLFVTQRAEGFTISRLNLKLDSDLDFSDPNLLETLLEVKFEDSLNPVVDLLIDTLPERQIDVYIILQNSIMKKWTGKIPYMGEESDAVVFEECAHEYNLESIFGKEKIINAQKGGVTAKKHLKLYRNFIANQILYSHCHLIELNTNDKSAESQTVDSEDDQYHGIYRKSRDLSAGIRQGKILSSQKIQAPFNEYIQYFSYSTNEGRLALIQPSGIEKRGGEADPEYDDEGNKIKPPREQLIDILIISPLYNSRVLPQFNHSRFVNPIAPLVDIERGFTSVFTLNLKPTILENVTYDHDIPGYLQYGSPPVGDFDHSVQNGFQSFFNITPGLLIKFFNGLEITIPMKEKLIRCDRFVMSKDGLNLVISGLVLRESPHSAEVMVPREAILLCRINSYDYCDLELIDTVFFADECITKKPAEIDDKIEFAQSEIKQSVVGEYDVAYYGSDATYYPSRLFEMSGCSNEEERKEQDQIVKQMQQEMPNSKFAVKNPPLANFDLVSMKLFNANDYYQSKDIKKILEGTIAFGNAKYVDWDSYINPPEENADMGDAAEKLHSCLKMFTNNFGHVFIIDQLFACVYFIYRTTKNKTKCHMFKFGANFKALGADSNEEYIIINDKNTFKMYKIDHMLKEVQSNYLVPGSNPEQYIKVNDPFEIDTSILNIQITLSDKEQQLNASSWDEVKLEELENPDDRFLRKEEGNSGNNQRIISVQIMKDRLLIQLTDDDNKYFKIMNIKKQTLLNYVEYDQMLISGDKQFAWFPLKNMVFDIENNLSTLFFWPGNQINTFHYTSYMDNFTINENRTIMGCHGCLQLTFNFISATIDNEELPQLLNPVKSLRYPQRAFSLSYILPTDSSVLKRILNPPSKNTKDCSQKMIRQIQTQTQGESQQSLQMLINFLSDYTSVLDPKLVSCFFLSYINKEASTRAGDTEQKEDFSDLQIQNIFEVLFSHKTIRRDLIEEIQRFVVKSLDLPIIQQVMNKSFIEFLEIADTSQAFKEYLENGIMQTSKMEGTDKYPIQSNEEGIILNTNQNPIIDDQFHTKFSKPKEAKKDVSIQYIYLGDLLNERGIKMMSTLSDIKYIDMMSIPFISYLVNYQWVSVQDNIKIQTLYPFYSLLALFTIFTFTVELEEDVVKFQGWHWISYPGYMIINGLLLSNILYFLTIEFRQAQVNLVEYLGSLWNLTDLISYSFCMLSVIFELIDFPKFITRPLVATTVIILWIKLFYFLRVYDSTSQLIRMIIEIVKDIKYFMIVLLIGIIGFTGGLYVLQKGINTECPDENDAECLKAAEENDFVGNNAIKAFIYTYRLTLGDFQLDNFGKYEEKGLTFEFYYIWFIFIFGSLFLVIVLLNLLIAIMGSTYENVQNQLQNLSIREKVLLVSENESLFSRERLFKWAQYLIIIKEKKIETSKEDDLQESIGKLRSEIQTQVQALEDQLKTQIGETHQDLKKKFVEQDERSIKVNEDTSTNYKQHVQSQLEGAISKINEILVNQQQQIGKVQQQQVADQSKLLKMLQDKIGDIQTEQRSLKKNLYAKFEIENDGAKDE